MWLKILIFIPLAILSNTIFPLPFEPVLLAFVMYQTRPSTLIFVLFGTICAAIGSWIDVRLSQVFRQNTTIPSKTALHAFYLSTFLCAFFPVPFSFIRIALLKMRPPALPYILIVAIGRLARYWMIAQLSASLL